MRQRIRNKYGYRYFGNSVKVSNNSWQTGLNGNDLIFGTSGSGKTRGYVLPNIIRSMGSIITIDSKNQLYKKTKDSLESRDYTVELLDFENTANSTIGYNPLDFIGKDGNGNWSSEDIRKISHLLMSGIEDKDEPFWSAAAESMIETYITFIMESVNDQTKTINMAADLMNGLNGENGVNSVRYIRDGRFKKDDPNYDSNYPESDRELRDYIRPGGTSAYPMGMFFYRHPDCRSAALYTKNVENMVKADRTYACIMSFANMGLNALCTPEVVGLNRARKRICFSDIAKHRTAIFINVSDSDRSKDALVSLFYNQLFEQLLRFGRSCPDSKLPIPVRIFMDDFSSGTKIDHFDKLISVIRSYDISTSIILQSMTQLYSMYGEAESKTIANNCDHILYLGGQDIDTINFVAEHADRTRQTVMGLPLDKAILITRGEARARTIPNIYIDLTKEKEPAAMDETLPSN